MMPSARFSNHPGRDQLSQVGSQMNIITSKHTLLYNSSSLSACSIEELLYGFLHKPSLWQLQNIMQGNFSGRATPSSS